MKHSCQEASPAHRLSSLSSTMLSRCLRLKSHGLTVGVIVLLVPPTTCTAYITKLLCVSELSSKWAMEGNGPQRLEIKTQKYKQFKKSHSSLVTEHVFFNHKTFKYKYILQCLFIPPAPKSSLSCFP